MNATTFEQRNESVYRSQLAYVNVCSGSILNSHNFNSKIVDCFYSTTEEKSIVSFYHLYHKVHPGLLESNPFSKNANLTNHAISSFAVLSKSTREISFINKFQSKLLHTEDPPFTEEANEANNTENQALLENQEDITQGNAIENPRRANIESESRATSVNNTPLGASRQSGLQFREYMEKLEKKNPFKEINVVGMRLSPCGRKVVAGSGDEHLKFWEVFKRSENGGNDLGLALLSEWR